MHDVGYHILPYVHRLASGASQKHQWRMTESIELEVRAIELETLHRGGTGGGANPFCPWASIGNVRHCSIIKMESILCNLLQQLDPSSHSWHHSCWNAHVL